MIANKAPLVLAAVVGLLAASICLTARAQVAGGAQAAGGAKGLVDSECCKAVKIPLLRHRARAETDCFQCCMDAGHKMWFTTLKACHCSDQTPGKHHA